MDFGSIFLILSLAVVVAMFVSRPFLVRKPAGTAQRQRSIRNEDHQRSALLAERDRLLIALRDLDFDQDLGKIPAEDYPVQRAALLKAGADVLRQLEAIGYRDEGRTARPDAREGQPAGRREWPVVADSFDDELEEMIAEHRKARQEKTAGFCPRCGKPVRKSDKFCGRCGAVV